MTDTPFKVGETYKTRDGREARLVGVAPDGELVFAVRSSHTSHWLLSWHDEAGRSTFGMGQSDILPPRRGVWVAVDVETGEPLLGWDVVTRPQYSPPSPSVFWRFFVEAEPHP